MKTLVSITEEHGKLGGGARLQGVPAELIRECIGVLEEIKADMLEQLKRFRVNTSCDAVGWCKKCELKINPGEPYLEIQSGVYIHQVCHCG